MKNASRERTEVLRSVSLQVMLQFGQGDEAIVKGLNGIQRLKYRISWDFS